jgi:4-amino-4-deoxy-L-arabinose transferase-like glycosyltransferase
MTVFAVLIVIQRVRLISLPIQGDICAYAVIGHEMMRGRELYSDLWERKPPLLYISYAAAELVVGYGPNELFLLGMVTSLISLVLIYLIGQSRGRVAGLMAAAL